MGVPQRRSAGLLGYVHLLLWNLLSDYCLESHGLSLIFPCRGNQPAIITSTTVDVVVPSSIVPVIYGEDGECLKQIRQVCLLI